METSITSSADHQQNLPPMKFEDIEIKYEVENVDEVDEIEMKGEEQPLAIDLVEDKISLPSNSSGQNNNEESLGKSLQKHFLLHRKPKQANIFQCTKCGYQEFLKGFLKICHVVHECTKPVEYRCNDCEYQTLNKSALQHHLPTHRNPEEIDMLKCRDCDYQTLLPQNLKVHVVIHEDPDKVKKFKCNQCNFQTIHKRSLRTHGLTHIPCPSRPEVVFRCDKCQYDSFSKHELDKHLAKHAKHKKIIDELVCKQDDFQAVYNNFLKVKPENID